MASCGKIPLNLTVNHGVVAFNGVLLEIRLYLLKEAAHIFKNRNIRRRTVAARLPFGVFLLKLFDHRAEGFVDFGFVASFRKAQRAPDRFAFSVFFCLDYV